MTPTTIPVNAFIGWPKQPTDEELATTLGQTKPLWDELVHVLARDNSVNTQEWKSYSRKAGWSLSLKCKARTILYLIPCSGCFHVAFVLGGKAMSEARASKLPAKIKKILDEAPRYAEGTGVRIEIERSIDLRTVQKLAAIKLAN